MLNFSRMFLPTFAKPVGIVDDKGKVGGLVEDAHCVVMGDQNCDPIDGDAQRGALTTLLAMPRLQDPKPWSRGAVEQSSKQWGANAVQKGDPMFDTGDFEDVPGKGPGNLRIDYVLPSRSLQVVSSGVFWPLAWEPTYALVAASDHRLVWVDLALATKPR